MTGSTTTVGIEVRADGTQEAARDLAVVDASLKKIQTDLGGTAQPAGVAAQGLEQLGAAGKSAGAGLGAVGASAKKAAEGLGSVSKLAASAKFDKVVSDLGAMGVKLNANSLHARKLAKAMQQVERERAFQQLAADANLSTLQLAEFRAGLGDTRGALATLTTGFGLSKAAVLAFAAALAFGGKAALDAALQMDRLSKAYTTITGSSASAQQQLSYLYDVSNRLGLQFQSTAESAKTFFAAGKGTSLEKDLNGIFEAVSSAGAALSLSQDDMQGAFLALGQMISKGKVQAEELRGQLGERLPGAFQLAAKAMNMTTAELDKFMADGKLTAEELLPKLAKVMKEDFGAAAEAASQGLQGAINRLSTEWTLFKSSIVDSDAAVAGINAVRGAVGGLQTAFDTLVKYKDIFKALAVGAGLAGIVALAPKAADAVLGLAASFKVLLPLLANPWTLALAAIGAAAAGVYYYAEQADVATQAQRALNSAQELSVRINKELADSTEDSADSLGARAEAARNQLEALQNARQSVLDSMSSENESAFAGWNFASLSANKFVDAIDRLKAEASKTGDFKGFEDALRNIELEARAAGKDTGEFKDALSDARATAALGIKLDISIQGMENLFNVQSWLRKFVGAYGISLSEVSPHGQKTDWKEQRDNATQAAIQKYEAAFAKTDSGRLETLRAQKKEYQDQLNQLGSLLLTDEQRNRQSQILNGLLKDTDSKIKSILNKGQKKDNALEQAQRDLDAYNAELGKTEASIRSLRAQLATKPGELFTREQAKIAAEYEATLKQIDKQASDYARKKGISTEQARQLKSQKEIEAGLKRDLALREAQEKEEKRLADLAKDKYDFYKELEELTGQYGLSLKFQSEVIAAQVKELERLQIPQQYIDQWRQLKELQSSKDWADGAVRGIMRFKAEASDTASQTEDAFNGLFSGIQSSTQSMWEDFLETGKLSLSSLKSVFKSFIAQLLNIAVMNPIIVQIAGSVQNSLLGASAGSALAGTAQSGPGGAMNLLSAGTSFLPGGSVTGMINEAAAWAAPSLFSTTSGYMEAAGTELLKAGVTGTAPAATPAPGTFTSAFGAPALGASIGSFASPYVNNLLGLQNNKGSQIGSMVGGLGTTAVLGTMAATNFWNPAGWVAGGLAALGSIFGGSIGSLFGGGRKTHASVYGKMEDVGFSRDQQTYIDAFMSGATYDRAGASEAKPFAETIGAAAATTAGTILDLAAALPDEYRKSVEDQLASATWTAGRGISGASWNLQWWKEGMAEERVEEAVKDMMTQMGYAANAAFAEAGIGDLFTSLDFSSEEGLTKATNAVNSINAISTAIDQIKNPTTEAEQQAKSFMEQVNALAEAVKSYGLNATYADNLVEEYRTAYVDSYVKSLDEMFNPLSEIEQQAKNYKTTIDGYVSALTTMGASEKQLAQVRGYSQTAIDNIISSLESSLSALSEIEQTRQNANASIDQHIAALRQLGATEAELAGVEAKRAEVVRQSTEAMQRTFSQSLMQRWSTLAGTGDDSSRAISQSNELLEAVKQFGQDSAQVAELIRLQAAEAAHAAVAAAQSTVDNLQAQLSSLEAQRLQLQQQAIQAEISSIHEQLSAAKALQNTWSRLESSLEASRKKLWTGTNNISTESREKSAQREFDRLYKLAMSGDEEAAGKLADAGNTLLALRQDTAANSTEYMDAFYEVEGKLKAVREASEKQASTAEKQVTALEKQLEAQQAQLDALATQQATLEEIDAQIAAVGKELADAIKTLKIAQSNPNYNPGSSAGGSSANAYQTWEDRLLAEKVASLNRGEYIDLSFGISAGSWNASNTKQAMIDRYGSVEEWYRQVGKIEGFAVGGLAMPGWAIVGERGPELVNFSTPGRVYTAEQTQQMLAQPTYGMDGSSAASLAWMRERMDRQTEVMAAAYSVLTDIRQYERQAKEGIESMNENGVLTTVKTSNIQKTKWAD
jgi:tape measure domain-containing protein